MHQGTERFQLWDEMRGIHHSVLHATWTIRDDFNVFHELSKYSSRLVPDMDAISDFQSCIDDCGHLELPFTRGTYTWTGTRRSGRLWKRLDRILVNHDWLLSY